MTPRLLFILKRREDYNSDKHVKPNMSTGLYNSANFIVEMLYLAGVEAKIEVAIDNNCIDRLVTEYKPTHVIIEALWVVPSKFEVLTKLHPGVKWIVRLHSEIPFMAGEGMAMDWLGDYLSYDKVYIGVNAPRMANEIEAYFSAKRVTLHHPWADRVIYLPNYYPQDYGKKPHHFKKYWIDISCFGAVRLLKNHLMQAVASIKFAEKVGRQLRFHVNADRIEMQGDPVLRNLEGLFGQLADKGHQLVGHPWVPRDEFLKVCADIDIGLQVSFSETFNIVGADMISEGTPIVGSSEIPWSVPTFAADPTSSDDIAKKIEFAFRHPKYNVWSHRKNLLKYTNSTRTAWLQYVNSES